MLLRTFGTTLLGFAALTQIAPAQDKVEVGSKPVHEFRQKPINSMGIETLADLQGTPLLIEFWGTT